MDKLARFYTETIFSDLLVKNISHSNPNTVIDLGIGHGSLTKSAYNRWINAKYYGLDVDKKRIEKINNELPFIKIANASGLSLEIKNAYVSLKVKE
jgi:trans-aconitate methyltransferase